MNAETKVFHTPHAVALLCACRESGDLIATTGKERVADDKERTGPLLGHDREGGVDLACGAGVQDDDPLPDAASRRLDVALIRACTGGVAENGDGGNARNEFAYQFQPLWRQLGSEKADPGHVTSRTT